MELPTGKKYYTQHTEVVINTRQKVKVVFFKKDNSLPIKLLEPVGQDSSIYRFAKKGGGLHHLCFKCGDISTQINIMKEQGLRILAQPQPGEAFVNEDIAFVFAKQGLNVELIDTDKRARLISKKELEF